MEIIFNPVVISVVVLVVLSLLKVHVIFALVVSAIVAGLTAGLPLTDTVETLVGGMGGQAETALSYILLGIFASMIAMSGITEVLVSVLHNIMKTRKYLLIFILVFIGFLAETVIPVHIAFIPILVPPLLILFNKLKIDRRAVATALTFGLKAPYMIVPLGYGLIFQNIVISEVQRYGVDASLSDIPLALIIPVSGMAIGLLIALFITYRKPKDYEDRNIASKDVSSDVGESFIKRRLNHVITITAIVVAFVLQLTFDTMIIGAIGGIAVMFLGRVIKIGSSEAVVQDGVAMMGAIAFIMLIASGYANVLTETNSVDALVNNVSGWLQDTPQFLAALSLLIIGLVITMGIGTSFGTVPIIAAIFVPLGVSLGFSSLAIVSLIATAGALGDAGSPASDSTLGPTAGLNADGQHDHIWDTCVPTFMHYNIPLILFGAISAVVL